MLLKDNSQLTFGHVKAHTSSTDIASTFNRMADKLAGASHVNPFSRIAPLPTFALDPFALWKDGLGFIENNYVSYVDDEMARIQATRLYYTSGDRFPHPSFSSPQPFPYERSTSSYSALVQLYMRSGQLPTRRLLFRRKMASSSQCRFGCQSAETVHHLFIKCPQFSEYRRSTLSDIHRITSSLVACIPLAQREVVLNAIPTLLVDDASLLIWPMGYNTWYFGHSPCISKGFPFLSARLVQSISQAWHSSFIHLVGRIWGHVQRLGAYSRR